MAAGLLEACRGSADLSRASGFDEACRAYLVRARWPDGFAAAAAATIRPTATRSDDRGAHGLRQAALNPRRHHLRADQDGLARGSRHLSRHLEEGGISAMELQRQMGFGSYGTAGVAAQDPSRHGRAGPQAPQ